MNRKLVVTGFTLPQSMVDRIVELATTRGDHPTRSQIAREAFALYFRAMDVQSVKDSITPCNEQATA